MPSFNKIVTLSLFPKHTLNTMQLPIKYSETHYSIRKLVREEYIKLQNNLCCHCNNPLDSKPSLDILNLSINKRLFPKNFFNYPIHLHHDHNTDLTIGAVHCECNAVLWQYHDE
jgi:hypothetical protein